MGALRIVFMGTPAFAVPSLNELALAGHEVVAVVTRPDKPRGRGLATTMSEVKAAALSHDLPVLEPVKLKDEDFIKTLKGLAPDFIVVVAYGKILPESVLDIPKKGCVNLHASLLPKFRGAAPINWAIINGEKETGVSVMLMDRGMDTGPVLMKEKVGINDDDTAGTLSPRLSTLGAGLLCRAIALYAEDKIKPVPQDERLATYAPILKKEDGLVDWGKSAAEISNLVRGLYPWPGAYTRWQGKLLKIHGCRVKTVLDGDGHPGTVVDVSEGICVRCGSGVVEVTEVQPENKKRMAAREFVSGYRIARGERFT
jgi:methionyl-tRNA formyltransferase